MIPLFKVFMPETVMEPLRETLMSGYIGQGPKVEEFEHLLAYWFVSKKVLTVNSGTSAIQLALRLADVQPGDEVISTPMTCTATNMPILAAGAKIVWADIDPWTGNIDPKDVERKITKRTKAIVCVHWGGYPCDIDILFRIRLKYNVKLIQDAAHAFGTKYRGWPVSNYPDFTCYSFQAIKEITTVDGGALVCARYKDYERGKLLRWYGIDRTGEGLRCEADIKEWGYKFHMNDIAATIGIEQLKYVAENLAKSRANAKQYNKAFSDLGITLHYRSDRLSSYWLYTIRVKKRDEFVKRMTKAGIMTSKVHVRNDLHTCFQDFRTDLPGVDEFDAEQVSIPVGWWLTKDEVDYIIEEIRNVDTKRNQNERSGQLACELSQQRPG